MFPEHFFQASKLALSAPLLFTLILSLQNPGYCDLIKLKHGGEIRGKLQKLASGSGEVRIIETLTGGKIAVDSQQIEFITNRPLSVEEYESRSKSLSNTVEAHLELADWCSENHLTSQRHAELEKVLLLEPDHAKTRAALGYTKRDGEWMTRDELMRKNGYIRYKGRYVSTAELELLEKNEAELAEERKWAKKIKLWLTFMNSNNVQLQQEGLKNIQAINDPFAVAALARQMGKHENYLIRSLLVSTLSQITGDKPLRPLAELALSDPLQAIRESALQALSRRDVSQAIVYFIEALKNRSNMIVQRAGEGLKVIGDESVVPELIAALITTHTYRVRVPDTTTTYSFGTNGTFGNTGVVLPPDIEAGLLAGRYPNGVIVLPSQQTRVPMRTISVKHSHQNEAVLSALQEITQQNFGYNQRLWQLWWSSTQNKTGLVPVVQ
ncbi:HEAT repeat domain-containing protein [Gimesia sp.]|uniref:HEAT repeat domain-containing protein n=1 Tax=Gimesia sp. TaxID=2024833 RepID=UPI003A902DC7